MSQQIAIMFQQHSPDDLGYQGRDRNKLVRFRDVSFVAIREKKTFRLGVDITDTTRSFSRKETDEMGAAGWEHLNK